jgi:monolysocardiolipin acyltransferase
MNQAVTLLNEPHNAWIHIFPEARVYQAPNLPMRYFKIGVSKLLLEPEKTPIVIPMFHSGMETVMREEQIPPQFIPSIDKNLRIRFGDPIPEEIIQGLRDKWKLYQSKAENGRMRMGEMALRMEATLMVRDAVNRVRSDMGFPPEPPNSNDPSSFPPQVVPPRRDVEGWFTRARKE